MAGMALLNVRLGPDDARRAKALRKAGIPISQVVRNAIRTEYDRRVARRAGALAPSSIVAEILAALPDPSGLPPREIEATDRRAVRVMVAAKLARKRT